MRDPRVAKVARVLSAVPAAIQLRYLQTLMEIGMEQNSTIVFPVPIDVFQGIAELAKVKKAAS